jgi:hypothetical protein
MIQRLIFEYLVQVSWIHVGVYHMVMSRGVFEVNRQMCELHGNELVSEQSQKVCYFRRLSISKFGNEVLPRLPHHHILLFIEKWFIRFCLCTSIVLGTFKRVLW